MSTISGMVASRRPRLRTLGRWRTAVSSANGVRALHVGAWRPARSVGDRRVYWQGGKARGRALTPALSPCEARGRATYQPDELAVETAPGGPRPRSPAPAGLRPRVRGMAYGTIYYARRT